MVHRVAAVNLNAIPAQPSTTGGSSQARCMSSEGFKFGSVHNDAKLMDILSQMLHVEERVQGSTPRGNSRRSNAAMLRH